MKKLISLLLVLVLSLSLLSGIALADDPMVQEPVETTQADASVSVSSASDASVYYFETLNQEVVAWTCKNLPAQKTITLLKDLELTGSIEGFNYLLKVPNDNGSWYANSGSKSRLVLDLNGKTLTYTGSAFLFHVARFGFTVKNGTILYKSDSADNAVITMSDPHGRTATTSGASVWTPNVTLDDVKIYNISENGGNVVLSYQFAPVIEANDCTLWSTDAAIDLQKTTQTVLDSEAAPYEGDYLPQISITASLFGSAKAPVFSAVEAGPMVELTDSTLVTGAEGGALVNDDSLLELDAKGMDAEVVEGWATNSAAGKLTGTAYQFGDAVPAEIVLPFEDVKEGDWYYEFVKEMYAQGIINGMSESSFAPEGTLTYGQALKLIAVGLGEGEQAPTTSHWASGYVKLAQDKGWVETEVSADGSVSRLAFCQIAAKAKGLTEQPEANPFKDTADEAVLALVKAGVISGMSADTFAPDNTLTRAQISKIISLLLKL